MSKLKTVWDAVNEFEASPPIAMSGEWSFDYTNTCTVIGYSYDGEAVCTKAEFNALVEEMTLGLDVNPVTHGELYNYVDGDKTPLEKEAKPDYTSLEFWKDTPEGYNAFMPESERWYASWFSLRDGEPRLMIRIDSKNEYRANTYATESLMSDGLILRPQSTSTETLLEKEAKPDYTSLEFWEDAPEHYDFWLQYTPNPRSNGFCCVAMGGNYCFGDGSHPSNIDDWVVIPRPQSTPTETPEEKEALDSIVNKPLIYTQEMADNGELPSVGSEVLYYVRYKPAVSDDNYKHHGEIMDVVCHNNGLVVLLSKNKSFATACNDMWIRPIDTRTKKEKAIDAIDKIITDAYQDLTDDYKSNSRFKHEAINLLDEIIDGTVDGVKWVGE